MASTVTSSRQDIGPSRPGYGQLLRTPGAWTFLLPGFAARQPFAMLTISIVLLVQHTTGSYGTAGAVAAVTGVSMALFAPYSGRLADRHGQRAVLMPGVLVHTLAGLCPDGARADGRPPVGAVRGRRAHRRLGAADRPHGAGPLGRQAPGLAPDERRRRPSSPSRTSDLRLGPVLATALCTAVAPGGRPGHRGRADPGRRPAVRRAARAPSPRSVAHGRTRAWSASRRCPSPGYAS